MPDSRSHSRTGSFSGSPAGPSKAASSFLPYFNVIHQVLNVPNARPPHLKDSVPAAAVAFPVDVAVFPAQRKQAVPQRERGLALDYVREVLDPEEVRKHLRGGGGDRVPKMFQTRFEHHQDTARTTENTVKKVYYTVDSRQYTSTPDAP